MSDTITVESNVRVIIAKDTDNPQITAIKTSKKLLEFFPKSLLRDGEGAIGNNIDINCFLEKFGIDGGKIDNINTLTVEEFIKLLESKHGEGDEKLLKMATESRVLRLIQGIALFTSRQLPVHETLRWWNTLATQILWWYARQSGDKGVDLVNRAVHSRAVQSLNGLELLKIEDLAKHNTDNAGTIVDVLMRLGYPEKEAVKAYESLMNIALKLTNQYDGKLQRLLRQYGDKMVDLISNDLLSDSKDTALLKDAVRGWVSTTTSLPISVWSPSTNEFVKKFSKVGVSGEMLGLVADELSIWSLTVDNNLAEFFERLCKECDPFDAERQLCVKMFASRNLQVECPSTPYSAASHYINQE